MSETLLEIKDLKKTYDGKQYALNGIDLTVKKGEFIVVIGPSGAGKSTLIRSVNRMIDATDGSVQFNGVDMSKLSTSQLKRQRTNIGMIFQHYNLIGRSNVIKNVLHGRLGYLPFWKTFLGLYPEEDKKEAVELLKKVGLKDQIYKRADALSGGQMQRVGICRAIMQRPQLILADEPIASLDPKSANVVMNHLKTISEERKITCMVNLHQVDFAKRYASRIIGIKNGEVVYDGSPDQLEDYTISSIYMGKEDEMTLEKENEENLEKERLIYGEI